MFTPQFPAYMPMVTDVEKSDDIVEGLGVSGVFAVGASPKEDD